MREIEEKSEQTSEPELPQIIYPTEDLIWPNEPGIVFESEAQPLLLRLVEVLDPLFENEQTLKTLATALKVKRMVVAHLTPPNSGWLWFNAGEYANEPDGPWHKIEVADWLDYDQQIKYIAHELSHAILGPAPHQHHFLGEFGKSRSPEIDREHRLYERVCNWGAGYILSRINAVK